MKTTIVHQQAWCDTCGKRWEDYRNSNARKAAYSHAKRTGHKVHGETGTAWDYDFSN